MTVYNSHVTTGDVVIAISYLTLKLSCPQKSKLTVSFKSYQKVTPTSKSCHKVAEDLVAKASPSPFHIGVHDGIATNPDTGAYARSMDFG